MVKDGKDIREHLVPCPSLSSVRRLTEGSGGRLLGAGTLGLPSPAEVTDSARRQSLQRPKMFGLT